MAKIQKEIELLIIDNQDSFTWNLVQLVEETKMAKVCVISNLDLKIEEIEKYDGIIISPGPGLPKEHKILSKVIQKYGKTKSILGVCLGMQLIAEVFGARLEQKKMVIHGERKKTNILGGKECIFKGLDDSFEVGLYHSWIVERESLPENLELIGVSEDYLVMAIKHKEHSIWGIQFHPESILTEVGDKIMRNWISLIV